MPEDEWIRHRIGRLRALRQAVHDRQTLRAIDELIAEAEERLGNATNMRPPAAEAQRIDEIVFLPSWRWRSVSRASGLSSAAGLSTERDIRVKQELAAMAVHFDQFAEELERDPSAPLDKPDSPESDRLR